jgi:hypothetical protein
MTRRHQRSDTRERLLSTDLSVRGHQHEGRLWGQAVWKQREIAVLADSALGEAALES